MAMVDDYSGQSMDVLLVEDNPGDIRLTEEALKRAKAAVQLHTVRNGDAAISFLKRDEGFEEAPRPHLVLLDLNLPRTSGHDVLRWIKTSDECRAIPVIILTTSGDPDDIGRSYEHYANCYVRKPLAMSVFQEVVNKIDDFWLTVARLPEA